MEYITVDGIHHSWYNVVNWNNISIW